MGSIQDGKPKHFWRKSIYTEQLLLNITRAQKYDLNWFFIQFIKVINTKNKVSTKENKQRKLLNAPLFHRYLIYSR